jgi:hypothetical protein
MVDSCYVRKKPGGLRARRHGDMVMDLRFSKKHNHNFLLFLFLEEMECGEIKGEEETAKREDLYLRRRRQGHVSAV